MSDQRKSRMEQALARDPDFQPVSRIERILMGEDLAPKTREEMFYKEHIQTDRNSGASDEDYARTIDQMEALSGGPAPQESRYSASEMAEIEALCDSITGGAYEQ